MTGRRTWGKKFKRQRYCFCMRYAAIPDNYLLIIVDVIKHLHFSSTVINILVISTIYINKYKHSRARAIIVVQCDALLTTPW